MSPVSNKITSSRNPLSLPPNTKQFQVGKQPTTPHYSIYGSSKHPTGSQYSRLLDQQPYRKTTTVVLNKILARDTVLGQTFFLAYFNSRSKQTHTMAPRQQGVDEEGDAVMAPMTSNYNDLNKSQSTVWKFAQPLFAKAMKEHHLPSRTVAPANFRVADLGCATGGNSIAPLAFVSQQLAMTTTTTTLEVMMGDLPPNAWNSVVATVTPDAITKDHDRSAEDTFVFMVGRSFYERCAPPSSLDLSFSLVAVHWMKSYAGDLPSGMYATDPKHVPEVELLQAWKEAGASDFLDFTRARHYELKPGARFIGAVSAGPKANGHFPWSRVALPLYEALKSKVTPDALGSCDLPCCYRNEADVRAGFPKDSWELEICEFHETKDPERERLEQGELTPTEYGKSVIESFTSVGHPTCLAALSKHMGRDEAERVLQEAYVECINHIAADPEQYNLDVAFWYVLARKK